MNLLPPPGPARRRQLSQLGILVLGLAAVAWYQWPQAVPGVPASNVPAGRAAPATSALTLPEPVRLGDLAEVPPASEVGRNPFGFGVRPAPPQVSAPSVPIVDRMSDGPPIPDGPPPIGLRLAGLLVAPGTTRTMATLKDPGTGGLFHAFEGDIVDGRYRLVKVGNQSVVVSYVDGSGMRTLGLTN
jgi:hypothetical protein